MGTPAWHHTLGGWLIAAARPYASKVTRVYNHIAFELCAICFSLANSWLFDLLCRQKWDAMHSTSILMCVLFCHPSRFHMSVWENFVIGFVHSLEVCLANQYLFAPTFRWFFVHKTDNIKSAWMRVEKYKVSIAADKTKTQQRCGDGQKVLNGQRLEVAMYTVCLYAAVLLFKRRAHVSLHSFPCFRALCLCLKKLALYTCTIAKIMFIIVLSFAIARGSASSAIARQLTRQ